MDRTILHIDMNNFYASVECLHHPEWKGKCVAVCGDAERRHGIVLAKSEEAKAYGVKTAETVWQAKKKCPDLLCVPPHFALYQHYSEMAREIYASYTDRIESFGLDECWLDVTDCSAFGGDGKKIADEIRERIRTELGLTASAGVSFNKIFAKLGSDLKKPDATTVISRQEYPMKVWQLPIAQLLFVGHATEERLHQRGIETIGDLAKFDPEELQRCLGKFGRTLWLYANGEDEEEVALSEEAREPKSVGNSVTTPYDLVEEAEIKITMCGLCEKVAARLREKHLLCSEVQISLRDSNQKTVERQGKLDYPCCVSGMLLEKAMSLYKESGFVGRPLRLLGVRACRLDGEEYQQLSFLPEAERIKRKEERERAVDGIRKRFGNSAVQRAVMLENKELAELSPKK